jgi:uncharacterized protein (DUF1330 family)
MLATAVGAVIGAASMGGLQAQVKTAGAYAIVQFTDFGDPAGFKTNVAEPSPAIIKKHGGHFVARTDTVTVLRPENPPLTRYVIIGFDNVQQAKDWYNSEDWRPVATYLEQKTKGRAFAVEAMKP